MRYSFINGHPTSVITAHCIAAVSSAAVITSQRRPVFDIERSGVAY